MLVLQVLLLLLDLVLAHRLVLRVQVRRQLTWVRVLVVVERVLLVRVRARVLLVVGV